MCCLLLLLPILNVRLIVSGPIGQEWEESRQPTEEERSSEDSIDARSGQRRQGEQLTTGTLTLSRGANNCRTPAVYSFFAEIARSEHQLRNGVGGPSC